MVWRREIRSTKFETHPKDPSLKQTDRQRFLNLKSSNFGLSWEKATLIVHTSWSGVCPVECALSLNDLKVGRAKILAGLTLRVSKTSSTDIKSLFFP